MLINMSYHYRPYIKNKMAYKKLNIMIGGDYKDYGIDNFYVIHSINAGQKQLLKILSDGYLRPGRDVKHPHILATENLEYIYTNLNFDDINNIIIIGGCRLFFHPKLLYEHDSIFNTHWRK